jgi:hypothetical protein
MQNMKLPARRMLPAVGMAAGEAAIVADTIVADTIVADTRTVTAAADTEDPGSSPTAI